MTPPRRLLRRIKSGKYVNFDHLLSPQRTSAVFQPLPQHRDDGRSWTKARRVVSDLPTWLEAWNIYLAARLSCVQSLAPELAKYQATVTSLFAAYRADACIQYDNLFRQCAARDPTIRWDTLKDDIFVWATAPSNNRRLVTKPGFPGCWTVSTMVFPSAIPAHARP